MVNLERMVERPVRPKYVEAIWHLGTMGASMNHPNWDRKASNEHLLKVLREHAYSEIAVEEILTIEPTEHGARVPGHWVERTDERIAEVLPTDVLLREVQRRGLGGLR